MQTMSTYGDAAVCAKRLILENRMLPADAWKAAISRITKSKASQTKSCPKAAFLGLCEAGLILGIPASRYSRRPNKNAEYALIAWELLRAEPDLCDARDELWARATTAVGNPAMNHNGQMDVVLSLWRDC